MTQIISMKPGAVTSPVGDVKCELSSNFNKYQASVNSDMRRKTMLSFKSVWCGCFSSHESNRSAYIPPVQSLDSKLLPSSAVQCLLRSDRRGSLSSSDSASDAPVSIKCAELPTSVLFTKSVQSSIQKATETGDKIDKDIVRTKSSWRNMHFLKPSFVKSSQHSDAAVATTVSSSAENSSSNSNVRDRENIEIDEALVFSPLPSQKAPEILNIQHNLHVINKIDVPLLYAPRFDSLFKRHTALLGPRSDHDKGKKCFVIDLDETLVHSSFKAVDNADFKVGVEIDGVTHRVYVMKRPHVDAFLSAMANLYECVLFTASLAKYADPVADFIDKWSTFRYRLFRESCVYHRGNYVKDLSHLGRPINQIVILDNSPASYMFHAGHAVQISSWFDDANDTALLDLIPYFERLASQPNVVDFLRHNPPPTPHAAVGTVGLPMTPLGATLIPCPDTTTTVTTTSTTVGKAPDNVISSIRRSGVISPFPHCFQEHRPAARLVPIPISEAQLDASRRLPAGQPPRVIASNALPVITKMAAPNCGPTTNPGLDHAACFPAPLSLAAYIPITSHNAPPLSTTSRLTGDVTQVRTANTQPLTSHKLPANSLVTSSATICSSSVPPSFGDPSGNKNHPESPLQSRCSSWGENHCVLQPTKEATPTKTSINQNSTAHQSPSK